MEIYARRNEILRPGAIFQSPYYAPQEFTAQREVNQFRVKVSKEGIPVLRSGRMQVRRKSECSEGKSERGVSASMYDPMVDDGQSGRGENWMKHGSADAVCSFQATGLCNLFANPGYCGTTGSLRRSGRRGCGADGAGDARPEAFCQAVFHPYVQGETMRCRQETRVSPRE